MSGTIQMADGNGLRLVAVATLVLAACTSIETDIVYDDQVDFGQLHGYEWRSLPDSERTSPLVNLRVVAEVDRMLTAKGFIHDPLSPSFLVDGYASTWGKSRVADWNSPKVVFAYPDGTEEFSSMRSRSSGLVVQEYREGTLVLEFFDISTMSILWRGTARIECDDHETQQMIAEMFSDAVRKLMDDFPPR